VGELTEHDVKRVEAAARQVVRKRLNAYPNARWLLQEEQDIVQEAVLATWRAISDEPERIKNLEAYARAAAVTACNGFFHERMPARASVAASVRYYLAKGIGFSYGEDKAGFPVAGYSVWSGKEMRQTDRAQRLCDSPESVSVEAFARAQSARVPDLLQSLFNWTGCPVPFDTVVSAIAEATGRKDPPMDVMDPPSYMEPAAPNEDPVELMIHRGCLEQLWKEVRRLKPKQAQALLLNFRDTKGRGILDLMLTLELCGPEAIAEVMSLELSMVAALWNDLPMQDKRISGMMNCSTQQVVNLRSLAHKTIQQHMGDKFLKNCFA
jgi:hypothetical protein